MEELNFPQVYAAIHKDENVRKASRSGGVFTAFSDQILKENGVVYGVVLKNNILAEHTRVVDSIGRDAMRGSKYIQSSTKNTFKEVQEDLKKGKHVLYTGTSCQIAGLKGLLQNQNLDHLYCIDIVCHGVPSPIIWQDYVNFLEKKLNATCTNVDFRDKNTFGWTAHYEKLTFRSHFFKRKRNYYSDTFKKLYYGHYILRPSCYKCPYKSITHPGDITIADYWGIKKAAPELYDDKGVSLVLINNQKGYELLNSIKPYVRLKSTRIEDSMQPPLKAPFSEPINRAVFWEDYHNMPFEKLLNKYVQKRGLKKLLHNLNIIKKVLSSKWNK